MSKIKRKPGCHMGDKWQNACCDNRYNNYEVNFHSYQKSPHLLSKRNAIKQGKKYLKRRKIDIRGMKNKEILRILFNCNNNGKYILKDTLDDEVPLLLQRSNIAILEEKIEAKAAKLQSWRAENSWIIQEFSYFLLTLKLFM